MSIEVKVTLTPEFNEKDDYDSVFEFFCLAGDLLHNDLLEKFNKYLTKRKEYLTRESEFIRYCNTPCWKYTA